MNGFERFEDREDRSATSAAARPWSRREFLRAGLAGAVAGVVPAPAHAGDQARGTEAFADLEGGFGGRLGVFALDTGSGRTLSRRADERFAMCSTFKWVLAAAVLERFDRSRWSMDDSIPYTSRELLDYAPVAREHVAEGRLPLETLLHAAVVVSDNTAANLLLGKIGGPPAFTSFVRSLGDRVTRLDRLEPDLNTNLPDDPRDTTTPRAMALLMRRVLVREVLPAAHRERLVGWMKGCTTGRDRLRAGLPGDWEVGDKTGTGLRGAFHDVAIAWPPGRAPIVIVCYMSEGEAKAAGRAAIHAGVARRVVQELAARPGGRK